MYSIFKDGFILKKEEIIKKNNHNLITIFLFKLYLINILIVANFEYIFNFFSFFLIFYFWRNFFFTLKIVNLLNKK